MMIKIKPWAKKGTYSSYFITAFPACKDAHFCSWHHAVFLSYEEVAVLSQPSQQRACSPVKIKIAAWALLRLYWGHPNSNSFGFSCKQKKTY